MELDGSFALLFSASVLGLLGPVVQYDAGGFASNASPATLLRLSNRPLHVLAPWSAASLRPQFE